MKEIKNYTDIPQSMKLAEILPIESADMCYIKHASSYNPNWEFNEDFPPMILGNVPIDEVTAETLPCWSLTALLELLPATTLDISYDHYYRIHCCGKFTEWHDTAVDAAVAMIKRLKQQNEL